jgi:hypothetical protein
LKILSKKKLVQLQIEPDFAFFIFVHDKGIRISDRITVAFVGSRLKKESTKKKGMNSIE